MKFFFGVKDNVPSKIDFWAAETNESHSIAWELKQKFVVIRVTAKHCWDQSMLPINNIFVKWRERIILNVLFRPGFKIAQIILWERWTSGSFSNYPVFLIKSQDFERQEI